MANKLVLATILLILAQDITATENPNRTRPHHPTLHPTTARWAGGGDYYYVYPTAYPTTTPTYDYHSTIHTEMPTNTISSYVPTPTSPSPTPTDNLRGGRRAGIDAGDETNQDEESSAHRCPPDQQFFQLDLHTDYYSCETSWKLERIVSNENEESEQRTELIDEHEGYFYDTHYAGAEAKCLDIGQYRFTIFDLYGDGLESPGYYVIALDGVILGGGSEIGWEEHTLFAVGDDTFEVKTVTDWAGVKKNTNESVLTMTSEDGGWFEWNVDDSESDSKQDVESPVEKERPELLTTSTLTDAPVASPNQTTADSPTSNSKPSLVVDGLQTVDGLQLSQAETTWAELLSDDFENDYNTFHAESDEYVTYYPFVKGRRGVLRLQDGQQHDMSSVYSDSISLLELASTQTSLQVQFSYYANSMESFNDGFCLDYSTDNGIHWHAQQCWYSQSDFENERWYDDTAVAFEINSHDTENDVESVRIRFRCLGDSLHDDILIDRVAVFEMVDDGIDLKDSK